MGLLLGKAGELLSGRRVLSVSRFLNWDFMQPFKIQTLESP